MVDNNKKRRYNKNRFSISSFWRLFMNKILRIPSEGMVLYRRRFKYIARLQKVKKEYEEGYDIYPCIVLVDTKWDIVVKFTGYERFVDNLLSAYKSGSTLYKKAVNVCHFLNFYLWETSLTSLNELTLTDIKNYLIWSKKKEDDILYADDTWTRRIAHVFEFLTNFQEAYIDSYHFAYSKEDLFNNITIYDAHHRETVVKSANKLSVRPPKNRKKKNRFLLYGYLALILYDAKKYDPMLVLAIALQAYAGLREGEVMNMTCGRFEVIRGSFGIIESIELDLTEDAPFWKEYKGKTKPASFKKNQQRVQKVYTDFLHEIQKLYEEHISMLESKGYDTSKNAPLFLNGYGNPMTVQCYTERLNKLFNSQFLPHLKESCIESNTYVDNAAFIEKYEKEYPGAHMFRHWFTMYLLDKAGLEDAEVMRWRNDHSTTSMIPYISTEGHEFRELYRKSTYRFQEKLLEDIRKKYED